MKFGLKYIASVIAISGSLFAYAAHAELAPTKLETPSQVIASQVVSFKQDAQLIRDTYEPQLYTLPAFKMGHYGLRMYRQTLDLKYQSAIWADMARVASKLNTVLMK